VRGIRAALDLHCSRLQWLLPTPPLPDPWRIYVREPAAIALDDMSSRRHPWIHAAQDLCEGEPLPHPCSTMTDEARDEGERGYSLEGKWQASAHE
jgi:hypothetical protein